MGKSMIIFLTDGQATTGVTGSEDIRSNIEAENSINKVPIYGLAFGSGADFNLMKTLSQENGAFARKIFEASDAAIQLEDFYLQIAGPKLQNVKIEYVGEAVKNETFTKTTLDTFNEGNEIVITGQIDENDIDSVEVIITGEANDGPVVKLLLQGQPTQSFQGMGASLSRRPDRGSQQVRHKILWRGCGLSRLSMSC